MRENIRHILFLLVIVGWVGYCLSVSIVTPDPNCPPINIDWSEAYEASPQEFEAKHLRFTEPEWGDRIEFKSNKPKVERLPPVPESQREPAHLPPEPEARPIWALV